MYYQYSGNKNSPELHNFDFAFYKNDGCKINFVYIYVTNFMNLSQCKAKRTNQ